MDQFVYGTEGTTVLLTCGLGGGEGVEWKADGNTPLTATNGGVWLYDVDHTHQGEYTCTYGKNRLNYFLFVEGTLA